MFIQNRHSKHLTGYILFHIKHTEFVNTIYMLSRSAKIINPRQSHGELWSFFWGSELEIHMATLTVQYESQALKKLQETQRSSRLLE